MVRANPEVRVLLFDVFGTVVDWRTSIATHLGAFGRRCSVERDWAAVADSWRARYQPSLQEVRVGRRRWVPLDALHRESLVEVLAEHGVPDPGPEELDLLTAAWHDLQPWPDTCQAWPRLAMLATLAGLSNADVAMSTDIARNAGIEWHAVFGAEPAQAYKPQASVYLHAAEAIGLAPERMMMVAAHNRDLEAADTLGFGTALVIRPTEHGPSQTTDLAPTGDWDVVCGSLVELADALERPRRRPRHHATGPPSSVVQDDAASIQPVHEPVVVRSAGPDKPAAVADRAAGDQVDPTGRTGAGRADTPAAPAAANLTRTRIIALAIVLSVTIALAFNRGYQLGLDIGNGNADDPVEADVEPAQRTGSERTDRSPELRRAESRARGRRPRTSVDKTS